MSNLKPITARIPCELDEEIENLVFAGKTTKQSFVISALQQYVKTKSPQGNKPSGVEAA